jgi:5-hydroxyisourate hydrolase-like protein (transthyretin family)
MRRYLFILIIGLSCQGWSQEDANPSSAAKPETKKAQTGSVSGQVFYEDTGKPVRNARIILIPEEQGGNAAYAVSDREGNFHIPKVEEGNYAADVESPGCISAMTFYDVSAFTRKGDDNSDNFDTGKLRNDFVFTTVNAGREARINAFCKRGGAISGIVAYEDGSPAPNVHVNLFRKTDSDVQQLITGLNASSLTGNRTDDRGYFRIAGLPAGEYLVAASEDSHAATARSLDENFLGFGLGGGGLARIFYGDVPSLKEAKSIRLAMGEERSDADIHLMTQKLHSISGILVAKSDQHPVSQANIALTITNPESHAPSSALSVTDEEGRWTFDGIPDGAYTIMVNPGFEVVELQGKTQDPDSLKSYEAISRDITVQGKDLEGVKLEVKERQNKPKRQNQDDGESDHPPSR